MGRSEWRVESGKWRVENGGWREIRNFDTYALPVIYYMRLNISINKLKALSKRVIVNGKPFIVCSAISTPLSILYLPFSSQ